MLGIRMRYLVMSVSAQRQPIEVAGHRGTVLGDADTRETALDLAAEWRSCGAPDVIVVDSATGAEVRRVEPHADDDDAPAESQTRPSRYPRSDSIPVAKLALRRVRSPR